MFLWKKIMQKLTNPKFLKFDLCSKMSANQLKFLWQMLFTLSKNSWNY